jgi:hypothetical protein
MKRNSAWLRRVTDVLRTSRTMRSALLGGGVAGNEQLTAVAGVLLIVLLAVLGVTIVRIRQLIWLHLFLGLLLIGPVMLKMATTAYRFARYYLHDRTYVEKGPPPLVLRALGPGVVLTTIGVFATGVVLLFLGPAHRSTSLLAHKVTFILWLVFTGLHVLGHLPGLSGSLRAVRDQDLARLGSSAGNAGRWIVLAGGVLAGVIVAVLLLPHFSIWTAPGAFPHHEH